MTSTLSPHTMTRKYNWSPEFQAARPNHSRRIMHSNWANPKIRNRWLEQMLDPERRAKMMENAHYEVMCPTCGTIGNAVVMHRWHTGPNGCTGKKDDGRYKSLDPAEQAMIDWAYANGYNLHAIKRALARQNFRTAPRPEAMYMHLREVLQAARALLAASGSGGSSSAESSGISIVPFPGSQSYRRPAGSRS